MKRTVIAASLAFAIGLSAGCNRAKDEVLPDGTKLFGHLKLKDGTTTTRRIEYVDGQKVFDDTRLPDGSGKAARVEFADGEKKFDVIELPDGSEKAARVEYPNGVKHYEVTWLPNGSKKIGHVVQPDGAMQFDVTVLPHLEFRGLRAGMTRAEVEVALKKLDGNASLNCEEPKGGTVFCEMEGTAEFGMKALGFSPDGRLVHFMYSKTGSDSGDFFAALQKELAGSNHKNGTPEPTGGGVFGDYLAKNGVQDITWSTPQTVVCYLDQEKDDCPAEKIALTEYPRGKYATIEFTDNAYYSEGMVKKDKNRPKPKVAQGITFLGLYGGEPRPGVEARLRQLGYSPLACEYKADDLVNECTTSSGAHSIDHIDFVHGRFSSLRFHYPASEHDELYEKFVKELGDPTDFAGKKGSELFTWDTESTVPCLAKPEEQCPDTALMFAPPEKGENEGTVLYLFVLLININIEERTKRTIRAAHDH